MFRNSMILISIALLFFNCQGSHKTNTAVNEKSSVIAVDSFEFQSVIQGRDPVWYNNDDTLFGYCKEIIQTAYSKESPETELELEGASTYKDDYIIAASVNEIQKTGSWQYTNSSMVFIPDGDSLLPVRLIPENLSEKNPFQYPNRINGRILKRTDVNGNGRPEYLFEYESTFRTNFHKEIAFYELDPELHVLYPIDMSAETEGFVGECEDFFGQERKVEIVEQENELPIIVIKTINSRCENGTTKIIDEYRVNWQWSKEEEKFKQV